MADLQDQVRQPLTELTACRTCVFTNTHMRDEVLCRSIRRGEPCLFARCSRNASAVRPAVQLARERRRSSGYVVELKHVKEQSLAVQKQVLVLQQPHHGVLLLQCRQGARSMTLEGCHAPVPDLPVAKLLALGRLSRRRSSSPTSS